MHAWCVLFSLSLAIQWLSVWIEWEKKKICLKILQVAFSPSYLAYMYLYIYEANVRNTNQFQCYLNVLRSFLSCSTQFFLSLAVAVAFASLHTLALNSFFHIAFDFHSIAIDLWSTVCWLLMYVCTFISSNINAMLAIQHSMCDISMSVCALYTKCDNQRIFYYFFHSRPNLGVCVLCVVRKCVRNFQSIYDFPIIKMALASGCVSEVNLYRFIN